MAEKVYKRLFEQEPGWGFMGEMMDYTDGLGVFSDENMQLGYWKQHYDGSGKPLDLAAIWRFMDNDTNGIAHLATRIFSIIANSGATECNFSDFGNIQTKRRSRLSVDKTHKINIVRMDIRRCHAALGVLKTHGKRKLGHTDEPESTTEDPPSDNEEEDFSAIAHNLIIVAINDRAADEAED